MASQTNFDGAIESVKIDGNVILKIIKHCRENVPNLVTGALLGMDNSDGYDSEEGPTEAITLECTSCFALPTVDTSSASGSNSNYTSTAAAAAAATAAAEAAQAEDDFQMEMVKNLREVNTDSLIVGWYCSSHLGTHLTESIIDTQFGYQDNIPKSCVLVYDPLRTAQGSLALRAYRLTDAFMAAYRDGTLTKDKVATVNSREVLEEIPIKVHTSLLAQALLHELNDYDQGALRADYDHLSLSRNPFLEKNLELLLDGIDELHVEMGKLGYYERSVQKQNAQQQAYLSRVRHENSQRQANGLAALDEDTSPSNPIFKPIPPPSRLDSIIINNQIANNCAQINQFAGQSFSKLFLCSQVFPEASK